MRTHQQGLTTLYDATTICACVAGKGSNAHYAEEMFPRRLVILTKHVNSDENLELVVLLALQAAVAKLDHPPSEPLRVACFRINCCGLGSGVIACLCDVER